MSIKVFVLGRPGSGKSTAARYINRSLEYRGWLVEHVNDYEILQRMFLADTEQKQFRATEHNGFDAIDLSVLDIALQEVEQKVQETLPFVDLITIEFARDDYRRALEQFSPEFLRDAYFLFMDADIETCLRRVHERVRYSVTADDHPSFSEGIFRSYYRQENGIYMATQLQQEFNIQHTITVIDNTGPLKGFLECVDRFAAMLFERESRFSESSYILMD